MSKYKLSISMPCFGRPLRTVRAIECIRQQNINGWEAFLFGDNCPDFQKLIDNGHLSRIQQEELRNGNQIHFFNNPIHTGGYGHVLTNLAIQSAKGEYIVFYANDDIILPNHFQNYLEISRNSQMDYMYFDTWLDPIGQRRVPKLAPSEIGHSEIILKTSLAKELPNHHAQYGHDWDFIRNMSDSKNSGKKSNSNGLTYRVMHIPNYGTKDIID